MGCVYPFVCNVHTERLKICMGTIALTSKSRTEKVVDYINFHDEVVVLLIMSRFGVLLMHI